MGFGLRHDDMIDNIGASGQPQLFYIQYSHTSLDTIATLHVASVLVLCVVDHENGYVDHRALVAGLRLTVSQKFRLIS